MSTNEKKIDAIYNAIEQENYKAAIKLCKQPELSNLALPLALMAYCHVCLKEKDEALEVARRVARALPMDQTTIQTLGQTFKAVKREAEMIPVLEHATSVERPEKSALLLDMFWVYSRLSEPKQMQLVAQKLYKLTSKSLFIFWSVCSMLLQPDLPPTMLVVAEKMLSKVFDANPDVQPGAEELEMYVHCLTSQGRHDDALSAFNALSARSNGKALHDEEEFEVNGGMVKLHSLRMHSLRAELLTRVASSSSSSSSSSSASSPSSSTSSQLVEELKVILSLYPDQWIAHKQLVECVLDSFSKTEADVGGKHVSSHQAYLIQLQKENPRLRGPYLAEIYLLELWISKFCVADAGSGMETDCKLPADWKSCNGPADLTFDNAPQSQQHLLLSEYCKLICNFFEMFQSRPCCFSDVRERISLFSLFSSSPSKIATLYFTALMKWSHAKRTAISTKLFEALHIDWNAAASTFSVVASGKGGGGKGKGKGSKKGASASSSSSSSSSTVSTSSSSSSPTSTASRDEVVDLVCHWAKHTQMIMFCSLLLSPLPQPNAVPAFTCFDVASSQSNNSSTTSDQGLPLPLPPAPSSEIKDSNTRVTDTAVLPQPPSGSLTNVNPLPVIVPSLISPSPLAQSVALHRVSKTATVGGIGGEKEVQPGDELMVLASQAYRMLLTHSTSKSSLTLQQRLLTSINWSSQILYSMESSPHNYVFKLDALEAYRELGAAEPLLVCYTGLGTRYIQTDTMSYLLVPALLETGFFLEAYKHNKAVLHLHMTARNDSLDAMSKCFKASNYMKVLEIKDLLYRFQHSIQYAVSKVEHITLDLTITSHTTESALLDLSEYAKYPMDNMETLAKMVDNLDVSLYIRPDCTPSIEAWMKDCRRGQLYHRIVQSQHCIRLLTDTLSGEVESAWIGFDKMKGIVRGWFHGDDDMHDGSSISTTTTTPNDTKTSVSVPYFQWSQLLQGGLPSSEDAIWNATSSLFYFCIWCATALQVALQSAGAMPPSNLSDESRARFSGPSGHPLSLTLDQVCMKAEEAGVRAVQAINALKEVLLTMNARKCPMIGSDGVGSAATAKTQGKEGGKEGGKESGKDDMASKAAMTNVEWIRSLSLFVRTMVSWSPLLLQATLHSLPFSNTTSKGAGGKKGKGAGGKGASSAGKKAAENSAAGSKSMSVVQASIANLDSSSEEKAAGVKSKLQGVRASADKVCASVIESLLDLFKVLGDEGDEEVRSADALIGQWDEWEKMYPQSLPSNPPSLLPSSPSSLPSSFDPLRSYKRQLADQVISSHCMSCQHMRDIIKSKLELIRDVQKNA